MPSHHHNDLECEETIRARVVREVAGRMLIAARTAPKAKGVDTLRLALVGREGIESLSEALTRMAEGSETRALFLRDAANILRADLIVLAGTAIRSLGLRSCSMCGFRNCAEKDVHPEIPCIFNTHDLGIAIGSAVSVAMEARVDNRVMYTVGQGALELRLLGDDVRVAFGIPLAVAPKNPFFDRP